jgi:hypothetical protein
MPPPLPSTLEPAFLSDEYPSSRAVARTHSLDRVEGQLEPASMAGAFFSSDLKRGVRRSEQQCSGRSIFIYQDWECAGFGYRGGSPLHPSPSLEEASVNPTGSSVCAGSPPPESQRFLFACHHSWPADLWARSKAASDCFATRNGEDQPRGTAHSLADHRQIDPGARGSPARLS